MASISNNDSKNSSTPAPVTWFEIHTADPERAERFYGDVFGWSFDHSVPSYSMIDLGDGAPHGGGIAHTDGQSPAATVFNVQVADVAAACQAVSAAGGSVIAPATSGPGGVSFAYVADPDGSMFGLWKPPQPTA